MTSNGTRNCSNRPHQLASVSCTDVAVTFNDDVVVLLFNTIWSVVFDRTSRELQQLDEDGGR